MITFGVNTAYTRFSSAMHWFDVTTTLVSEARSIYEQVAPVYEVLAEKHAAVDQSIVHLQTARIHVAFYELQAETATRNVYAGLKILDNGRIGDYCKRILPEGLKGTLKPRSAEQVVKLDGVVSRIRAAGLMDHPIMQPLLQALELQLKNLNNAVLTRTQEYTTVDDARNHYTQAKAEFLVAYSRAAAQIKALYPRNKTQQDFFFEKTDQSREPKEEAIPEPQPTE